jgi:hypothetical protein
MTIDFDSKNVLTRKQKEEIVLDLYFNQNKTIREIAKIARMSPRDIKAIVDKAYQEKERKEHKSLAVQAYELFYQGKTPLEVAIILNIGQTEVTHYYTQYLSLVGWDDITKIYVEFKGDTTYLVNLCKVAKSAKMGIRQVIHLLDIANNDLLSVQYRYKWFLEELNKVNREKSRLEKEVDYLSDQIIVSRRTYQSIIQDCDKETARLLQLQQQTKKQDALVEHFENDNGAYIKIIENIEDKVNKSLSDKRAFLKLAIFSLIESVRSNPEKYSSLIYHNNKQNSNNDNSNPLDMDAIQVPPVCSYHNIED